MLSLIAQSVLYLRRRLAALASRSWIPITTKMPNNQVSCSFKILVYYGH